MVRVRSKDTTPEIKVRSVLYKLGYRFRLHRKGLPGTPDLVLPKHRLAVFVHGCFWHRHHDCSRSTMLVANAARWVEKFERNQIRDAKAIASLEQLGWRVVVIWECETKSEQAFRAKLDAALRIEPSAARQSGQLADKAARGEATGRRT